MGKFIPHPYQQDCINAVIERPGVALWLEMGLGKTVVTLTAISTLIQLGEVDKVLIIAPQKSRRGDVAGRNPEMGAPARPTHEHRAGHRKAARACPL